MPWSINSSVGSVYCMHMHTSFYWQHFWQQIVLYGIVCILFKRFSAYSFMNLSGRAWWCLTGMWKKNIPYKHCTLTITRAQVMAYLKLKNIHSYHPSMFHPYCSLSVLSTHRAFAWASAIWTSSCSSHGCIINKLVRN